MSKKNMHVESMNNYLENFPGIDNGIYRRLDAKVVVIIDGRDLSLELCIDIAENYFGLRDRKVALFMEYFIFRRGLIWYHNF